MAALEVEVAWMPTPLTAFTSSLATGIVVPIPPSPVFVSAMS